MVKENYWKGLMIIKKKKSDCVKKNIKHGAANAKENCKELKNETD